MKTKQNIKNGFYQVQLLSTINSILYYQINEFYELKFDVFTHFEYGCIKEIHFLQVNNK